MAKIINVQEAKKIIKLLKIRNKKIVLIGGCFDILHIGHIKFLKEAKKLGDLLIVFLESDEKVKKLKGKNRPIFSQQERALVLSGLSDVDYIILLPPTNNKEDYNQIILQLKPDIIAVTENDPLLIKKKSQAQKVNGKIEIIPKLKTFSSSKLIRFLGID